MRFSDGFVDELRTRLVLSDLIGRRVKLIRSGTSLKGCCPFHQEKSPSFNVYEKDGHYHCFGCGAHGDAIDFVRLTENLSFPETVAQLAQSVGMALPLDEPHVEEQDKKLKRLRALMESACAFYQGQLRGPKGWRAVEYMTKRALTGQTASDFRLGFAPGDAGLLETLQKEGFTKGELVQSGMAFEGDAGALRPRFRDRLMFPITDRQGRVIAFGGRLMGPGEPKYLNSPESPLFHKGRELYGQDHAWKARASTQPLLVCEGYMDVISLVQGGFDRCVAPLGTALTQDQISLLWRLEKEPVLCFDGDAPGQKAAVRALERALPLLKPGHSLNFATLPCGQDPSSLLEGQNKGVFIQILSAKKTLLEMLWDTFVARSGDVSTPERRSLWEKNIHETLQTIGDEGVRTHYRRFIGDKLFHHFRPTKFTKAVPKTTQSTPRVTASVMRERVLVVTFFNHPHLLQQEAEVLMSLTFCSPVLENVRLALLDALQEQKELDREGLYAHLKERGLEEELKTLLKPDVYMHAPFAKQEAGEEDVRTGWRCLLESRHLLEEGLPEVRSWKASLSHNMTPDVWAKVQSLRTSMDEQYQQLSSHTQEDRMEGRG